MHRLSQRDGPRRPRTETASRANSDEEDIGRTTILDTKAAEQIADMRILLAISTLRVSTREQAERGGTDEGFSIPAQGEANSRKADELGARIVREFVG